MAGPLAARQSASAVRPPLYPGLPLALRVARYRGLEPCENLFPARTGEGGRPLESTEELPVHRRRRVPVPAEGDIDEYEYGDGDRYVDEYGYRVPRTGTSTSMRSTSRRSGSSHGRGAHACRRERARVAPWSPARAERPPTWWRSPAWAPPRGERLGGPRRDGEPHLPVLLPSCTAWAGPRPGMAFDSLNVLPGYPRLGTLPERLELMTTPAPSRSPARRARPVRKREGTFGLPPRRAARAPGVR